jgi:hypothetical protein
MNWLPEHKCGLYLEHNVHKDVYETIEENYDPRDFVSDEEWTKAVELDSVWRLQWYPDTPVGFYVVCASTLAALEQYIRARGQS